MRNKLLITAAIGTMMSTAVFAQSSTTIPAPTPAPTPAPATGTTSGTVTGTMPSPPTQPGTNQTGANQAGANQTGSSQTGSMTPATRAPAPAASAQPAETMGEHAARAQPAPRAPRNFSTRASNILASDAEPDTAPVLPTPPSGDNSSPQQLLRDARAALERGQTGLAQEAIERAESRMLSRAVPASAVGTPVHGPVVDKLKEARHALGRNDIAASRAAVDEALTALAKSAMN